MLRGACKVRGLPAWLAFRDAQASDVRTERAVQTDVRQAVDGEPTAVRHAEPTEAAVKPLGHTPSMMQAKRVAEPVVLSAMRLAR